MTGSEMPLESFFKQIIGKDMGYMKEVYMDLSERLKDRKTVMMSGRRAGKSIMWSLEQIYIMNHIASLKEHIGKYLKIGNGDIVKLLEVRSVTMTCEIIYSKLSKKGDRVSVSIGDDYKLLPDGTEDALVTLYGGSSDQNN